MQRQMPRPGMGAAEDADASVVGTCPRTGVRHCKTQPWHRSALPCKGPALPTAPASQLQAANTHDSPEPGSGEMKAVIPEQLPSPACFLLTAAPGLYCVPCSTPSSANAVQCSHANASLALASVCQCTSAHPSATFSAGLAQLSPPFAPGCSIASNGSVCPTQLNPGSSAPC